MAPTLRTVGVEEELLLVDPDTGDPKALAAAVLARVAQDDPGQDVFEKELFRQMLEFATHPQSDMAALAEEIVRWRKEAARHAGGIGSAVAALATSPLPASPSLSVNERYQWLAERYGIPTWEQLVCGCHVHVAVESDEEGIAVLDRIRPWLPILRAISANSPFWQGRDTSYASYRSRVWNRWPSAGPTELFGSAERYHRRVADMVATGALLDEGMVYFDARLSARYPTVEIRVADVCLSADTAALSLTRPQRQPAAPRRLAGRPVRPGGGSAPPGDHAARARRAGAAVAAGAHRGRPHRLRRRGARGAGRRGSAAARQRGARAAPAAGADRQPAGRRHRVRAAHPGLSAPPGIRG